MKLNKKCVSAYNKAEKTEIKVTGIRKAINDYNYNQNIQWGIHRGYIVCNFNTLNVRFVENYENENNENILEENEIVIIDAKNTSCNIDLLKTIKTRVFYIIENAINEERKEAEKKQEAERKEALKELNVRLEAEKNINARIEAEKTEYKKIYSPFYTHTYTMINNDYKMKVGEYLVLCGIGYIHTFSPTTIQVAQTAGYKRIYRIMAINENEGKITVERIETKERIYFYYGYFIEQNEIRVYNVKKYTYAYNKAENKEAKAMIAYNFYNYLTNVLCYDTENWEKISKIISIHLDNKAVESVIYYDEHNNYFRMKKDRQLKINFDTNFASLEKIDNKVLNSSIKNTALFNYLLDDDTSNCFSNNELYQQIKLCEVEARKINNIPSKNASIYSYSFVGYLATMKTYSNIMIALENKDLNYSFNKLLVLRQTIHRTLNRITNTAIYNKYLFYYHCLNCIASIYNDYETEKSFKEFKTVLYKAIA